MSRAPAIVRAVAVVALVVAILVLPILLFGTVGRAVVDSIIILGLTVNLLLWYSGSERFKAGADEATGKRVAAYLFPVLLLSAITLHFLGERVPPGWRIPLTVSAFLVLLAYLASAVYELASQ